MQLLILKQSDKHTTVIFYTILIYYIQISKTLHKIVEITYFIYDAKQHIV